ncbi:MAG: hypothetical protein C7B44_07955 [Sulfobacillus thermosulfidooxidans]|uniref:Transporter n=1 Tax=Sulfobacillus thermotolerans TaxID=338644 RepID=A0ABN5GW96_9FIRM|nr:hypothetical protein [Sulfobacillus sp. hq2]AUW92782.1 hypothetical protein BXT84_01440 [Sulfobacillus thermotolerans]MCY0907780.1 hypothetical protein [Sulfobacillus thermotolerans]POB09932.1 hypothetical protein CO251_11960 [Sulfobacillus sp. hq2]PSR36637.1 MAG: hypothetical protein C7B44_07955 [Sulfobacillus thermosulfidooxidans]
MVPKALLRATRHVSYWLRWVIELLILLTLVFGIIAFLAHWAVIAEHPGVLLSHLREVLDDIFTLVLLVEMRDLFRHLSPPKLLDIVATVMARQLALNHNLHGMLSTALAIAAIVIVRGFWTRFFEKDDPEKMV